LSRPEGQIAIAWTIDGDVLHLIWRERGGPAIESAPSGAGFGTTLVKRTVASQFGGTFEPQWDRDGLVVEMTLKVDRLAS